jgi:hypothetical protein
MIEVADDATPFAFGIPSVDREQRDSMPSGASVSSMPSKWIVSPAW